MFWSKTITHSRSTEVSLLSYEKKSNEMFIPVAAVGYYCYFALVVVLTGFAAAAAAVDYVVSRSVSDLEEAY